MSTRNRLLKNSGIASRLSCPRGRASRNTTEKLASRFRGNDKSRCGGVFQEPAKAVFAAACLGVLAATSAWAADSPNLGKPISPQDIAPWDITIFPDGTGLPPGSGTPAQGAPIFAQKCSACHGDEGKGGAATPLLPGPPRATLDVGTKTIRNFWPYSTTLFDFIRRAMPYNAPHTLNDGEVYALTAYLLALNQLIGPNDTINAQTLPKVKMPNVDNFIIRFPDRI